VLLQLALIAYYWSELPEKIPIHFDASGRPDNWGGKFDLFTLPFISIAIIIVIGFLNKTALKINPHKWGAKTEEELAITRRLLTEIQIFISLLFYYILYCSIQVALGNFKELPSMLLAFIIGGFLLLLVFYFVRLNQIKKK